MSRLRYDQPPIPVDHESPLGTPVDDAMPASSGDVWHAGNPSILPPGRPQPPVVRPPGEEGPPRNTQRPVVLGTPRVGSALTATSGVWDNNPTEFWYFGLRDGNAIGPGGPTPVYTLQAEDEGAMMSVRVWATNEHGRGEATSFPIGPVLPAPVEPDPPPVNTGRPVVTGDPQIGHSLSSTPGTWTNNPANYAYQWLRLPFELGREADGGDIDGATNPTYLLVEADVGQRLACRVTASNSQGEAESTSLPTLPVRGVDWNPPSWLVRDNAIHEYDPDRPKPLYGVPTPDPIFHSIVTRISNNPGVAVANVAGSNWGTVVRPPVYQVQAWNCDQTLIYLGENSGEGAAGPGGLFLQGDLPYAPVFARPATWPAGADVRWHPTDPVLMDCARTNIYSHFNVLTGEDTEILNLGPAYSDLRIGHNVGNRSLDGKRIGFTANRTGPTTRVFITYDIEEDRRWPDVDAPDVSPASFTAARLAPDGEHILWNFTGDNYITTDLEGNLVHQFVPAQMAQGDVGRSAAGYDIFVGRVNSGSALPGVPGGRQNRWRLSDGQRFQLNYDGYIYTASLRAQNVNHSGHARWMAGDTRANRTGGNLTVPPYTCENLLVSLDGSAIYRLCHNFNGITQDNPAWSSPSLSPDGQRCIFCSVWNAGDNSGGPNPRPVQVYVVDYRMATMPPKPAPPVNTALPAITGTTVVGQQLICTNGTWTGATSFLRRWRRDGDPIQGATAAAYTLQDIDVGHMIGCQVIAMSATNGGYAFAEAPAVGPVTSPDEAPWEPPSWVITDRQVRDYNPARVKPGYLVPTPDPNFRSIVTRVSGDPGTAIGISGGGNWAEVCGPNYINHQAWSCDQGLLYILNIGGSSGSLWLDGETYQPRYARGSNWPSGADVRWHPTEPELMDCARTNQFSYYNPRTNTNTVVRTFTGVTDLRIGHNKGNRSDDGKIVVLTAMRSGRQVAIVYDIERDVVINELDSLTTLPGRTFSSCWASPSGTRMIWNMSPDNYVITDFNGAILWDFPTNYISHGDCCYDEVHEEVLAGRKNSSTLPGWTPNTPSGEIFKHRLRDGQRTRLTEGGWCPHTATRGQIPENQAYCVAATYDNRVGGNTPQHPPYIGEIIMPRLDGTKVYRLCQHMGNNGPDYETFAFAVQSPDSGRVAFRSDWRAAGATPRPVQAYVVDIRT